MQATPIEKLDILDTSNLPERSTVGAIVEYNDESQEIVLKLKPEDFEKLDPANVAIVKIDW